MNSEMTLEELKMVNGGIWDVLYDIFKENLKVVDEKWIEPAINEVVLSTKQVVNEAADEVVNLGNKIYDVI